MCNIRWKFLTPQKIPRENGGKPVKIVDVQESYWSVLQSSKDVSHPPISWGFLSFFSLSLSFSLSLLSRLPLRSVYSPGKIHRSDRDCSIFPGKLRPFGPFSCSLPISILLTFSSRKNRRSFTFFDCDQTA